MAKEPTRKLVVEWIIATYKAICDETRKNALRKNGYEWISN